jgi:hypothetical protein
MTLIPPSPTLRVYRRSECGLCDEARQQLQIVLEERAARGQPVPVVREIAIDGDAGLEAAHGARIPVFVLGDQEIALVTSARTIRTFLDRVLGQLV